MWNVLRSYLKSYMEHKEYIKKILLNASALMLPLVILYLILQWFFLATHNDTFLLYSILIFIAYTITFIVAVFLIGYARYKAGNRVLALTTAINNVIIENFEKTLIETHEGGSDAK